MTQPDANTWLIILFNCIAYVVMWFRNERKAKKREDIINYQHNQMWKEFAEQHDLKNGNGGTS